MAEQEQKKYSRKFTESQLNLINETVKRSPYIGAVSEDITAIKNATQLTEREQKKKAEAAAKASQ